MAQELILVTGVSGHIGFRVLVEALNAGHRVRAVVRKETQVEKLKSTPSLKGKSSDVDFVVMPDLGAENAFEPHMDGVSYIMHVASPQVSNDGSAGNVIQVDEYVKPAVGITRNVLEAAAKFPGIKKVIVTSSITTILTGESMQADSDHVYDSSSPTAKDLISPVPESAPTIFAYAISKVLCANFVTEFVAEKKPHFSVVSILPASTVGPNELASTAQDVVSGGNMVALGPILPIPFPAAHSALSHVDDAALSHIRSMDLDVPTGTVRHILPVFDTASNPSAFKWNDIIGIIKTKFPAVAESSALNLDGNMPTLKTLFATKEDEKALGITFKTHEQAVTDLLGQYLQLQAAAPA